MAHLPCERLPCQDEWLAVYLVKLNRQQHPPLPVFLSSVDRTNSRTMRKKGYLKIESPEKMPSITSGIEMTRGDRAKENPAATEYLTGGNGVADESGVQKLVLRFMGRLRG